MIVRNVPPELRAKIAAAVTAQKSNANDVVVGALAKQFKTPFVPTGRENAEGGEYETLILRVPPDLRTKIRMQAASIEGGTSTAVILQALAKHFGLSAVTRKRRPRRRIAA